MFNVSECRLVGTVTGLHKDLITKESTVEDFLQKAELIIITFDKLSRVTRNKIFMEEVPNLRWIFSSLFYFIKFNVKTA